MEKTTTIITGEEAAELLMNEKASITYVKCAGSCMIIQFTDKLLSITTDDFFCMEYQLTK
jgi:hypothetical protein